MNALISLIHSRVGALIQWGVGLFIGWLSSQIIALGIELPPEALSQLSVGLSAIGAFLVTFVTQWYQARQARTLQATLGAKPDGWIGSVTLAIAQGVSEVAKESAIRKP
jgi:hypothetical protein